MDRSVGRDLGAVAPNAPYRNPRLSPDAGRVVVERTNDAIGTRDLWLIDLARNVSSRFTFADQGINHSAPVWSPDGSRIAWVTGLGERTLLQKLASGTGKEERIGTYKGGAWVTDEWLSDGLIIHDGSNVASGVYLLPFTGGAPRLLSNAKTILTHARVAPGAHWVAFTSSDTGRPEVYIQDFPTPSQRIQVSADGGIQPLWRADGKELFYLAGDGKLMAVPVQLGSKPTLGAPAALFETHVEGGGTESPGIWHQYDVSPDGKRFLMNTLTQSQQTQSSPPIIVVVNWDAGLKK